MLVVLQVLVFYFGIEEIRNAKTYYERAQKKRAMSSFCIGVFACICGFFSVTNII